MPNETFRAWLTMLYEGEGSLHVESHSARSITIRISLAQKHYPFIKCLQERIGGSVQQGRSVWLLVFNAKDDLERIIRLMMPYLILKREETEHALVLLSFIPCRHLDDKQLWVRDQILSQLLEAQRARREDYFAEVQDYCDRFRGRMGALDI